MSGDEIDWVFDETRKLVAEESRLRQEPVSYTHLTLPTILRV